MSIYKNDYLVRLIELQCKLYLNVTVIILQSLTSTSNMPELTMNADRRTNTKLKKALHLKTITLLRKRSFFAQLKIYKANMYLDPLIVG